MHELKCPRCGETFTIDEAGYADIVRQVRDGEFERQLHERLDLADEDKKKAVELAEAKAAGELQRAAAVKEAEIHDLKAKLEAGEASAVQAFASLVGMQAADPLTGFHLRRLLNGGKGVQIEVS